MKALDEWKYAVRNPWWWASWLFVLALMAGLHMLNIGDVPADECAAPSPKE